MDDVRVDFCPLCRQRIDWALEQIPDGKIFIQANPTIVGPEGHMAVPLCEKCGRFVTSTLHTDGFTIHTP